MKLIQKLSYSLVYLLVILFIGLNIHQEVCGQELPQAKVIQNNGKYGLIGRENEVILEAVYDEIIQLNKFNVLHMYSVKKGNKYAIAYEIYKDWKTESWQITDFIYDSVILVHSYYTVSNDRGYIAVVIEQNGLQGILTADFKSTTYFVTDFFIEGKLSVMIEPKYKEIMYDKDLYIGRASGRLLIVDEKGLQGIIKMHTGKVYPPMYDKIEVTKDRGHPNDNEEENSSYKTVRLNNKQGRVYLASDGYREIVAPLFSKIRDLVTDTLFYALQNDTIHIYDAVKKKTYTPKYNGQFLTTDSRLIDSYYISYNDIVIFKCADTTNAYPNWSYQYYIYDLKKDSIVGMYKNELGLISIYHWIRSGTTKVCPDGLIFNNVYDSIKKLYTVEIINVSNQNLSYKFTSKYHSFPNNDAYYNKNDKSLLTVIEVYHPKKGYQPIGYYSITTGEFTKRIKDKNAFKNEKGEYRYNYKFYLKDL